MGEVQRGVTIFMCIYSDYTLPGQITTTTSRFPKPEFFQHFGRILLLFTTKFEVTNSAGRGRSKLAFIGHWYPG